MALASLLSSVAAAADRLAPAAQEHVDKGIAEYSAQRYEAAIRHFRAAYDIDPQPEVLFAWAQAERLSGDCASAITLYRRFLEQNPAAEEEQQAAVHLARCERALATRPAPKPAPAPVPTKTPPSKPRQQPAAQESEPWYADALGGVLAAGGIAAAGVGAGLLIAAQLKAEKAEDATIYGEFDEQWTEVDRFRIGGAIALGAGAALLVAAIVRYATRESEVQARASTLSIAF